MYIVIAECDLQMNRLVKKGIPAWIICLNHKGWYRYLTIDS